MKSLANNWCPGWSSKKNSSNTSWFWIFVDFSLSLQIKSLNDSWTCFSLLNFLRFWSTKCHYTFIRSVTVYQCFKYSVTHLCVSKWWLSLLWSKLESAIYYSDTTEYEKHLKGRISSFWMSVQSLLTPRSCLICFRKTQCTSCQFLLSMIYFVLVIISSVHYGEKKGCWGNEYNCCRVFSMCSSTRSCLMKLQTSCNVCEDGDEWRGEGISEFRALMLNIILDSITCNSFLMIVLFWMSVRVE